MNSSSPVFIIGTERSGSNLLRLILNAHPDISIPHPPHILKEMAPLERFYGELRDDRNFRKLVADVVKLVELHFFPWDVKIDAGRVFEEAGGRSLYCVKAAVYEQYARAKGKKRWGCKSTFVIHYTDMVRKRHPGAKFIHLVRDGRDVAVSARSSVFNRFHPYYVGMLWSLEQKTAAALAGRFSREEFITVRYEDLLCEPEKTVRDLCSFMREDFASAMLSYFEAPEAGALAKTSRSWEKCASPIAKDNVQRYKRELSVDETRVFETTAFEELSRFGYALENDYQELKKLSEKGISPGAGLKYWLLEKSMLSRTMIKSFFSDSNAVLRLKKRLYVLRLRMNLEMLNG